MFGKLSLNSIPYHDPIIMITCCVVILVFLVISIIITIAQKWQYLWNEWCCTVDHKKIAKMYIFLAFIMLFRGFADAIMMRMQQFLVSSYHGNGTGFLPPHHYDQIFTAHGVIMIFFVAMPLVIGLMNFVVPLQIGSRDVAFPFLNNLSLWLTIFSALLMNVSLGIGEFAQTGWLAYPPLSELQYSPGVGVDYWIWSLQISGIGTTLTAINFLVTIIKMRSSGMNWFKIPVFTWTSFCTNILIIASFPVLTVSLLLLTLDRYLGFHFFTNDFGGNMMMYVNLIWIWGHPEVYILILPVFGIFSEVVATFSSKELFGYTSLIWATIVITILSFIVWLHHFFTMGASANVNAFFGITTMIISIPTGVKIFNWLFTMYRGNVRINSIMLWTIGFLITFSIGGMAGVLLSLPVIDFSLHNSLFLVAHFHNVIIGGVVFGCFAGITYWFPKLFGFMLSEKWGKRAFWCWFFGFFCAFMPLYALGLMGMTRRLSQNINPQFHSMLTIAALGTILIFIGIVFQIIQIFVSIRDRNLNRDCSGDPWNGRTLEWSTTSPPPFYNFAVLPIVQFRDSFWESKKSFKSNKLPILYTSFHMPKNTKFGFLIGFFAFLLGFSAVWYIFWLFFISFFVIIYLLVIKSLDTNCDYIISIEEIKEIEKCINIKKMD
ncbi:ubiquinol oxidase polypeptide I [Buchnera aphidicola str. Bp (Baizongia pistaciae)]|uniref:Cytochrome bo(3) ubiquinol oxidase subunit 1 n=1 Tax=Buchnera aphidicola subsp. Baizongia pistaciae (strain Bp) TaxID=224915 RepID=CYOB_BUCBP|nr:cytochrome o ubiquinol oxidase subunit I [Buchnera aphidicola]Q89AA4.1 RecName: Full=Cytochrome bo(3) ubiquinol oxidase subunit 1; AltName: Full=Cytochrome o ubiquinol oxidase subunit 1; Short=Cytochrome o subunit 1; AltName: Full=Oxidase bo(3) subunit 1; AltName: Full=Ubiquinol oxidase polypeptide I; AltName: Full=Ubiquinol oxidase subunit 1 [Buchnera aphidicola str. Bp (Baizongia pistaciae)]AAO27126.1 ubiquinol oxidase polypeptide I [Buchnera aphidicola str. Bp (Baizongia pistaciae)]